MIESLDNGVWSLIISYLELSNLSDLCLVCKAFRSLCDSETAYGIWAHQRYPIDTIHPSDYNNTFKALLQDDNARGGMYVMEKLVVSEWVYNSNPVLRSQDLFYVNAIRYLIWDRLSQEVSVVFEAFGNRDLRPGSTSVLKFQSRRQMFQSGHRMLPAETEDYIVTPTYQFCRLRCQEERFHGLGRYFFRYGGNFVDYPLTEFLEVMESLQSTFRRESRFLPRNFVPSPSNVETWPIRIPESILQQQSRGVWGRPNFP